MVPPRPKYVIRPPVKPKRTRSRGIVREMPDKVIPQNDISSESSQIIMRGSTGQSVQKAVAIGVSASSSVKITTKVKDCLKVIMRVFFSSY